MKKKERKNPSEKRRKGEKHRMKKNQREKTSEKRRRGEKTKPTEKNEIK